MAIEVELLGLCWEFSLTSVTFCGDKTSFAHFFRSSFFFLLSSFFFLRESLASRGSVVVY